MRDAEVVSRDELVENLVAAQKRIAALEAENGRLLSRLETLSRNWHHQRHMGSWESCLLSCKEDRDALKEAP